MKIINGNVNYLDDITRLWNEEYGDNHYLKPLTKDEINDKLSSIPFFNWNNTLLAVESEKVIGAIIYFNMDKYKDNPTVGAIISVILVKKDYRRQGVGSSLLNKAIDFFKKEGKTKVDVKYFLPACFEWYIPNTDKHNHPCEPGIRINSPEYFFFLNHGFTGYAYQDAFHLDLEKYELSDDIKKIMDENKKDGITIELYDKNKHYGLDEFYEKLNIYDFEKVIKDNLALDKPYPFLVVAKDNRIVGWTGAMWNEESGRGHFDGIAILDEVRGRGLGKALFSYLAYYNKQNGAKFMTFYTGMTNHARFIYLGAGFKVAQSFCYLEKKI